MSYERRKAKKQGAPRRGRPRGLEGWDHHITGAPILAVRQLSSIAKSRGLSMADVARALEKPRQNFGQALTANGRISETIRAFAKALELPPLAQRVLFDRRRLTHRERRSILVGIRHEITRYCGNASATLNALDTIVAGMSPEDQGEVFADFVLAPYVDAPTAAGSDLALISRPLAALEVALKAKGYALLVTPNVDVVATIRRREQEAAIEFERFVDVFNLDDSMRAEFAALLKRFDRWPKLRSDFDVLAPDDARAIFPHYVNHSTLSPSRERKESR